MDINKICTHCMNEVNGEKGTPCPVCGHILGQTMEITHQLTPFTILQGKYLVGDVLGEGGFGITYIGFDLNLEMKVAIKEFYPNGYATREAVSTNALTVYSGQNAETIYKWRDNFLKEARSLGKCSHLPGVVGVRDFFQENSTAYIVLEYLEGTTLKNYTKSMGGKIPASTLLPALEPIFIALEEVHRQGLIHRDISPDNIMLLPGGQMKLLDFGAARDYTEGGEKSLSVMLKPGYAPEEQYRSKGKQGPWSDIYALAGTIYKCLTGVTPPEAMERMREDGLRRPNELGAGLTSTQEEALLKAMAVFAEGRYQTVAEFHDALYTDGRPIAAAVEEITSDEPPVQPANSERKDTFKQFVQQYKKILIGAGAGLAAVCIIALVITATGDKGEKDTAVPDTVQSAQGEEQKAESGEALPEKPEEAPLSDTEPDNVPPEVEERAWKEAFASYISSHPSEFFNDVEKYRYSVIYLNDDTVPEIFVHGQDNAEGNYLLYDKEGYIINEYMAFGGQYYLEREGLFENQSGRMGGYPVDIFSFDGENLDVVLSAYFDYNDESGYPVEDANGEMVLQHFWLNDEEVNLTEEEAWSELDSIFDRSRCKEIRSTEAADFETLIEFLSNEGDWDSFEANPVAAEDTAIHRYELVVEDSSWTGAYQACIERGGYLAHINTYDEFIAITDQIRNEDKTSISFWIGAARFDDDPNYYWANRDGSIGTVPINTQEFDFAWLDGEPSYSGLNEAEEEVGEMCVNMFYRGSEDRFYWNDAPEDILAALSFYSGRIGYICEYED